jgi:hypothetical protein
MSYLLAYRWKKVFFCFSMVGEFGRIAYNSVRCCPRAVHFNGLYNARGIVASQQQQNDHQHINDVHATIRPWKVKTVEAL